PHVRPAHLPRPPPPALHTRSLHDALPIWAVAAIHRCASSTAGSTSPATSSGMPWAVGVVSVATGPPGRGRDASQPYGDAHPRRGATTGAARGVQDRVPGRSAGGTSTQRVPE